MSFSTVKEASQLRRNTRNTVNIKVNLRKRILGTGETFGRKPTKNQMTPNQLAVWRISKALEIFHISEGLRDTLSGWVADYENIRILNAKIMAATLMYINLYVQSSDDVTSETFTDDKLARVMIDLQPSSSIEDPKRSEIIFRHKASILKYIRAIIPYLQKIGIIK